MRNEARVACCLPHWVCHEEKKRLKLWLERLGRRLVDGVANSLNKQKAHMLHHSSRDLIVFFSHQQIFKWNPSMKPICRRAQSEYTLKARAISKCNIGAKRNRNELKIDSDDPQDHWTRRSQFAPIRCIFEGDWWSRLKTLSASVRISFAFKSTWLPNSIRKESVVRCLDRANARSQQVNIFQIRMSITSQNMQNISNDFERKIPARKSSRVFTMIERVSFEYKMTIKKNMEDRLDQR